MKLAILGAGMIVKDFLSMVHQIPEIKLQAIIGTEKDIETMEVLKKQHSIGSMYTDFENCLKKSDIDTVYVALPNHLHYAYAKKALEYGKNVICEKPFTLKLAEMKELRRLSEQKNVVLIEAITNQYLANYREIKQQIKELGDLKLIECNYSQYSSRYDLFKAGTVLPAFNPKMGGGALMDINIYNIHFVVGLLGMPEKVTYSANIAREIDTSGILSLDYKDTKVICIGAKDSTAPIRSTIQGDQGSIIINGPTNVVDSFDKKMNKEERQHVDVKIHQHRMFEEFSTFVQVIDNHDMAFVKEQLDHSQTVMAVVEMALADAGIYLGD